jgi:hypothetical protein
MVNEIKKIAKAWIEMSQAQDGSAAYEEKFWAAEKLFDFIYNEPETAWLVIDAIRHQITPGDQVFWNLAAGPLEDLLVYHGPIFIDRFEELAKQDINFRKLLGGVWRNQISEDVWNRIQAIAIPGPR